MTDRPTADEVRYLIVETSKVAALVIGFVVGGYAVAIALGCAW